MERGGRIGMGGLRPHRSRHFFFSTSSSPTTPSSSPLHLRIFVLVNKTDFARTPRRFADSSLFAVEMQLFLHFSTARKSASLHCFGFVEEEEDEDDEEEEERRERDKGKGG